MKTNLSSLIKVERVSRRSYRPESEIELAALTRNEKVNTKIVETPDEGARDAAQDIAQVINSCVESKGHCVIAFGAGGCALDIYDELVRLYFADKVSFANVIAFNLSELGLGVVADEGQSTLKRLRERLFNKVDIDPNNIHTFSQDANKENVHRLCKNYEAEINDYGGLDLVVCELTKNAGLAYNEPGATMTSSCRLTTLSSDTRTRIAESYQCETAPLTAVTLGISNILAANQVIAVAWSADSARAIYDTVEGNLNIQAPASFLQMHQNVKVIADLEAASRLTRISHPWKVTSCEWTSTMIRRAIVWLSQLTGKPILKLTNKDYIDNGLDELVALYSSAYNVNIKVFNDLQHTITGWPGGKPDADDTYRPERERPYPKRVLAFGPHPDDVVVSMGGTLRRLVDQRHDVHVAFQTSGDVAVADEDLERYMMLSAKLSDHFRNTQNGNRILDPLREKLSKKGPGDPDDPDVRYIKGQIFTCEGIMACMYMGVARDHVHELDLPFYTHDAHGHGRVTDDDAQIIARLINEIKPHQIFFAADFNDPFNTHVPAADALLAAVDMLADEPFMADCRLWMYRGQWGEWDIDHIQMAVPMSPEEFSVKRNAILKHQSQVHDAPFRDPDDRQLSWQRSIDRNKATADLYSALGLANYEAIEAFVQFKL